ncbi:thiolase family protein [Quadrisphaera sp. GCM10027208]|uniref:thiolase family protein n=1 Tax=Quadrisphaera sp. GCM10027208 TaxID=3273423 RepID=UPI00361078C3|nr:thiolase family protein [Kineosporiaceae bacterium SCSIO 59966]
MNEVVIVDGVRSPMGRRGGGLAGVHPVDLLAHVLSELIDRTGIDAATVDDVIGGCVGQVGEQSFNVTRNAWLAAGLPISVPAVTVDRQCGSSQQALHFAAQGIASGSYDVAIACGVESMSRIPIGSAATFQGSPYSEQLLAAHPLVSQGESAERIAEKWGFSRSDLDAVAVRSHRRAIAAREAGVFAREIVPVKVGETLVEHDEGIREPDPERIASLKPVFREDGVITAANSSQITDGAAALLLMREDRAQELGLTPRARLVSMALAGDDPVMMLTAPAPATRKALGRAGLDVDDLDAVEINEAFASVVLAWRDELNISEEWYDAHVNLHGGAIAMGHPLGGSGARLMISLMSVLEEHGGRYGLQTMCEGGGQANATIIERWGASR